MDELRAVPEAISRYADAEAASAAQTLTAASVSQAVAVAAAVPVFGLIGGDFLATYAVAQANHLGSVAEIAAVHAGTALTVYESAALYRDTDLDSADTLGSLGTA